MKVSFVALLVVSMALLGGTAQAASFANTAAANDATSLERGRKKKKDDDDKKKKDDDDKKISLRALVSVHNVLHWAARSRSDSDAVAGTDNHAVQMDPDVVVDALSRADRRINPHARFPVQSAYVEKFVQLPEDGDFCRDARLAQDDEGNKRRLRSSSRQLNAAHDHTLYWIDQDDYLCPNWLCFDDDDFWAQDEAAAAKRLAAASSSSMDKMKQKDAWFLEKTSWQHGGQNHRALEAALCVELRNSGDPTMAHVTDCKIDWIYPREW